MSGHANVLILYAPNNFALSFKDPTLQRSKNIICTECGHDEAVFFQVQEASNDNTCCHFVDSVIATSCLDFL